MSLHHIYSDASNSTQDITAYVRLYQWSATTDAKEGSTAHSTMVVDDPDGILDFVGHRRLYSYEDLAAASNQVVYNGFIFGQKVSRGPYRNGAGRIWTLDLVDTNTLLNRRLMNGADANRPAENDVQRMEALIGLGGNTPMTELNTVDDSLYFSGVSPVAMDAVDYRTQPVGTGYVDDCAQASGKNYFVWYRESVGEYSLWYDFAESSNFTSNISLSNVLSAVDDAVVFAVDLEHEAELDRDPSRVASGVMLPFDGVAVGSNTVSGTVYVQDQTTTDTFAAIDWLAPSLNVKTKAKALARAERYLADAAEQDDLIHCSVKLPAANVNDILAGQRVSAQFSHLPGYEAFTWFRCLSRTVSEISEDPTRAYRLDLELSPINAEETEAVYSILYRTTCEPSPGTPTGVGWDSSGDLPDPGFSPAPTTGPVSVLTGPGDYNRAWSGWESGGTGNLRVQGTCSVAGVPIAGDIATVVVYLNGVTVLGSGSVGPAVGLNNWGVVYPTITIDTGDFAVVPGDTITATFDWNRAACCMSMPKGAGVQTENFTLTGNLVPA